MKRSRFTEEQIVRIFKEAVVGKRSLIFAENNQSFRQETS